MKFSFHTLPLLVSFQTLGFDSPAHQTKGTWTAEDSDEEYFAAKQAHNHHSLGCHLCYHNVAVSPLNQLGSGYFGARHTHNPLAQIMASEEKQRLQQSDSISSGSTVAPGGGCHENKAYDPDESGSSLASSPSPNTAKKDKSVSLEMDDMTPPQVPKVLANTDKITHPKDFYVSVNEHRKGIRGEKLYVTKDNRETRQNNCRSVLCITVVVLFLSAAVAVATLIGGNLKKKKKKKLP